MKRAFPEPQKRKIRTLDDLPPICGVEDIQLVTGYSLACIRRKLHAGLIKGRRDGRDWKVPREAVIDYYRGFYLAGIDCRQTELS